MSIVDNAAAIRDRAYEIWEREGRPHGREHEHWAEAARAFEAQGAARPQGHNKEAGGAGPEDQDVARLREALYTPAAFSEELFGHEAPVLDGAEATDPERLKHDGP